MQIEEYIKLEEQLSRARSSFNKESFLPLFEAVLKHPEVVCVGWSQYTPSFNDGDPCYFTLEDAFLATKADVRILLEDAECENEALYEGVSDLDDSDFESLGPRKDLPELNGAIATLNDLLCSESLMESVFGSGAKVRVRWDDASQETVWEIDDTYDVY